MAQALSYKRTTTTKLKASGMLDVKNGMIEIDGENISITTLLKDFEGCVIDFSVQLKQDEELDPPTDEE